MPHWVKRVVNGLENSSKYSHKRDLTLDGKPLDLQMIQTAWTDRTGWYFKSKANKVDHRSLCKKPT